MLQEEQCTSLQGASRGIQKDSRVRSLAGSVPCDATRSTGAFVAGKLLARSCCFLAWQVLENHGAPSDWGVRVLREHYKAQRKLVTSDAVSDNPGYQNLNPARDRTGFDFEKIPILWLKLTVDISNHQFLGSLEFDTPFTVICSPNTCLSFICSMLNAYALPLTARSLQPHTRTSTYLLYAPTPRSSDVWARNGGSNWIT